MLTGAVDELSVVVLVMLSLCAFSSDFFACLILSTSTIFPRSSTPFSPSRSGRVSSK